MSNYGLLGNSLKNDFSRRYFEQKCVEFKLNHFYKNYTLSSIDKLLALIESQSLAGFNVTIPFKEAIIPFLNQLDEEAINVGAVNTVVIQNQKRIGYNTDVYGFETSLKPLLKPHQQKALILGTGGASKAVDYVLKKLGLSTLKVSRSNGLIYDQLSKETIESHTLIVNCTPLGMYPKVEESPDIPYAFITEQHLCYDLIYLPEKTNFLEKCELQGAQIKNGLEMLHLQADKSFEIWTK